jgi:predicted porin
MIKGHVDSTYKTAADDNTKRNPSIYLKGGIDKSISEKLRGRVSASYYVNTSAAGSGNTLFWGDRTGSNYQNVMEKAPAGVALPGGASIPWSGRINPGFSKKVNALMLNGFLKVQGLELFGTYETAKGRTKTETADRKMNQLAAEFVYRIGAAEQLYVGARYNTVKLGLAGIANDVKVNRTSLAAGWFVTKNVQMKGEYVIQKFKDFPTADYRSGGQFKGFVIEAVVGF